jgi:hypothetical protein
MDRDYLTLKRASASRPSGEWSDDDYDVLTDGQGGRSHLQVRQVADWNAMDVDIALRVVGQFE